MKKKIYISAIYISPPNTMGGNTKIILELINGLSWYYDFIIFTSEPETFRRNLYNPNDVTLIELPYIFKKFNYFNHFKEIKYVYSFYKKYFSTKNIDVNDYFYSASDFGPDVIPIYKLRKEYNFKWIASLYLFIPDPMENIIKKYQFPFFKYIIYYFYQRYIFGKILKKFNLCLITNNDDKKYFPKNREKNLLAMYGGVNVEQIKNVDKNFNFNNKYDAIFCSRLHPQKGISQLLEIWKLVTNNKKNTKLGIIGSGEKLFEEFLKEKAKKLKIENNLEWLGYINNKDKYKIYLQSKFFIHSTIYDNNGMVAAEALCSGIPVIMYDLNELKFYQEGCIKIKVGNKVKYAEAILRLIKDNQYYNKIRPSAGLVEEFRKIWAWKNRANIFKNFLDNYEKNTH